MSELSNLLNQLPIFSEKPDAQKFRNVPGVVFKLSNFLPFDKTYPGKGMQNGSKLDKELFYRFENNLAELKTLAQEIRSLVTDPIARNAISLIEEDELTINDSVSEGSILYKWHKHLERNKRIVKKKKEHALKAHGKLACEACGFDFAAIYGEVGYGFMECHHRTPLAQIKSQTNTTLDDLALVCSNCHRMIHRNKKMISLDELSIMITSIK